MNIVFRTDASLQIGSGHVMRCLTLAGELGKHGATASFICRNLPGNLSFLIRERGFDVSVLPDDAADEERDAEQTAAIIAGRGLPDWLVVDQYALDGSWERQLKHMTHGIFVIDDLANRSHACNMLLDQNFYENGGTRYRGLVPESCEQLLGPAYSLLRPEFADARKRMRARTGSVDRILIFFGASDVTNETTKAIRAVQHVYRKGLTADVIIGVNNPHQREIETLAASLPWITCRSQVTTMADLMLSADLYLGAAGTTTWERCCLGLPSLVVTVADNQVPAIRDLAGNGILYYIGRHDEVQTDQISAALERMTDSPDELRAFSLRSSALVDGRGAERCAGRLLAMNG